MGIWETDSQENLEIASSPLKEGNVGGLKRPGA